MLTADLEFCAGPHLKYFEIDLSVGVFFQISILPHAGCLLGTDFSLFICELHKAHEMDS